MKPTILAFIVLSFIGCASNSDDVEPVKTTNFSACTNHETLTIVVDGTTPMLPPPPSECQETNIVTENGTITTRATTKKAFHYLIPIGYNGSFNAKPNPGYKLDGWYYNDVKIDSFSIPFMSATVTIEARMIPVSVN